MRKVALFIIFIVSLFIINSLVRSIYNLWQKEKLVTVTEQELVAEKQKYALLQDQMREVSQHGFVEREARNKLFLVKPGEQLVIVQEDANTPLRSLSLQVPKEQKSNPQQWWELFFSS